jgi:hypothetical protein
MSGPRNISVFKVPPFPGIWLVQQSARMVTGRTSRCPHCDEAIRPAAIVCPHCRFEVAS